MNDAAISPNLTHIQSIVSAGADEYFDMIEALGRAGAMNGIDGDVSTPVV